MKKQMQKVKQNKHYNKRRGFIIGLAVFSICIFQNLNFTNADTKTYLGNTNKRLEISISDQGINRISIEKDRILKIVGNDGDYTIDGDTNKGFVFINSKINKGNSFPLTLISEKGLIQDIKLKVEGDIDSRTVVIKPRFKLQSKKTQASFESQVTSAISDIVNNNVKYYKVRRINWKSINGELINREPINGDPIKLPLKKDLSVLNTTEYIAPNNQLKIIKIEYLEKRGFTKKHIGKLFPKSIAIAERGNNLIIVEKL